MKKVRACVFEGVKINALNILLTHKLYPSPLIYPSIHTIHPTYLIQHHEGGGGRVELPQREKELERQEFVGVGALAAVLSLSSFAW